VLTTLKIELAALRSMVRDAYQVVWIGSACLIIMVFGSIAFFFVWGKALGLLLDQILAVLPPSFAAVAMAALSIFLFSAFALWMMSMVWVHINHVFWSAPGANRTRIFAKFLPILVACFQTAFLAGGMLFLGWVINVALLSRLFPDGLPTSGLALLGLIILAVFSPLLVRLWYLPVLVSLDSESSESHWNYMKTATKGRGPALAVSIVLQLVLLLAIALLFARFVWPLLAPAFDLFTYFSTISAAATAMSNVWTVDLVISALLFALIAGPLLSVVAMMQVAVVRSLISSGSGSIDYVATVSDADRGEVREHIEDSDSDLSQFEKVSTAEGVDPLTSFSGDSEEALPFEDPLAALRAGEGSDRIPGEPNADLGPGLSQVPEQPVEPAPASAQSWAEEDEPEPRPGPPTF